MGVYETLSHISAYEILAASGALCELAGFLWVITGVSQALSRYGKHDLAHKVVFGIRHVFDYVFREPTKPQHLELHASAHSSASLAARVTSTGHRADESELGRLRRELRELRNDLEQQRNAVDERFSGVDERFSGVEQGIREVSEQLSDRVQTVEQRLTEIHTSSLRREKGGAFLFMFGTLLTLIAVLIG